MTPNPNENQAEKHSAEPLRITDIPSTNRSKPYWIGSDTNLSMGAIYGYENAAHLIACWNFCAGVPNTTLTEIGSLKASGETILNGLQKLNERFKKGQQLRAELSTLRKELEAAKKWADTLAEWIQRGADMKAKEAKQWAESEPGCGQSIWREGMGLGLLVALTALQRLQRGENILDDFQATRLNNGKDGK